jgi:4-hydroxybenzoate polyprenyltransferase
LSSELAREGQTFAGQSLIVRYANFVKLPHTVFALPFALLGVVVGSYVEPVSWSTVALVVVAFTSARFVAMGFNRIADREIDARNPRTDRRELVTGRLTIRQAGIAVGIAAVAFVAAAWGLNPLCGWLSIPALAWIGAYSYTKRFTHWTHVWLGFSLAIAPVGGYLAVTGAWPPALVLWSITAAVTFWVAGFDIFYALQDEDADRALRLRSAVVRFGRARSVLLAKTLHGLSIVLLVVFGLAGGLGGPYYLGVALGAGLIAWEHRLVRPDDLSRLNAAFFTANGLVSILVFLGALVDRVV